MAKGSTYIVEDIITTYMSRHKSIPKFPKRRPSLLHELPVMYGGTILDF